MHEVNDEVYFPATVHWRIAQDLDLVCSVAGIPPEQIAVSMRRYCSAAEIAYVTNLYAGDTASGMCYVGGGDVIPNMTSIAAACLRNSIDARVISMKQLVDGLDSNDLSKNTDVYLVANFLISDKDKSVAPWQVSDVLGWLHQRDMSDQKTIIAVSSIAHVRKIMGNQVAKFIEQKYTQITVV